MDINHRLGAKLPVIINAESSCLLETRKTQHSRCMVAQAAGSRRSALRQ